MTTTRLTSTRVPCNDSVEEYFDLALERGWSDGLPVIPPTVERVSRMVAGSGRKPDDLLGHMDTSGGAVTVEKVAINAVMAGCLPEYMPVILAAVEALLEPGFNLTGIQATTNPVAPLLIINGPIRHALNVNCGQGVLGPGWRANATIGRALRLVLLNLGGAIPAVVDRATQGFPGKFTFCMGELEEDSPWEPLHVERGLDAKDSAATVVGADAISHFLNLFKHADDVLEIVAGTASQWTTNNVFLGDGDPVVILSPMQAHILKDGGLSKQALKEAIYDRSKTHVDRFPTGPTLMDYEKLWARRGDYVYITKGPDRIMVVVAGGAEPYHGAVCSNFGDTRAITKRIPA